MDRLNGAGSEPPKTPVLSAEGEEALTAFEPDRLRETSPSFLQSHQDTEDLRYIAERYRRFRGGKSESKVLFEMEESTGLILVQITDEVSGDLSLRIPPDDLAQILKGLESTEDNESSLVSFFIDFQT